MLCSTRLTGIAFTSRQLAPVLFLLTQVRLRADRVPAPCLIRYRAMATDTQPAPLSVQPAEGQIIQHDGKTYETIREGKAYILSPPNTRTAVDPRAQSKGGEQQTFRMPPRSHFNMADAAFM